MSLPPHLAHVPPPDPENFWPFAPGQVQTIGVDPDLSFRVDRIHSREIDPYIVGTETLGDQVIEGELHMDYPVVISRSGTDRQPLVTLTLRKIEDGKAFIQVTARSDLRVGWRA